MPCKREGRRFVGQYVSSQNDIMKDPNASPPQAPELYFDRVAYSGWNFDLHNPKVGEVDEAALADSDNLFSLVALLLALPSHIPLVSFLS